MLMEVEGKAKKAGGVEYEGDRRRADLQLDVAADVV